MLSPQKAGKQIARQQRSFGAFTLMELLVVLGMVVIVSVMLVPALAATKPNSKVAQCLNDKRQLTLAWQMYAADNSDSILSCITWIQAGSFQTSSYMDWTSSSRNTNTDALTNPTNALIARYVKSAAIFKCPGDYYQSSAQSVIGPRVRSVSLNAALGSSPTFVGPAPGGGSYVSCKKMSDLAKPGPAAVFAFLDEHPDSINDGVFSLDPGCPPGLEYWRDLPASYHNGAVGISFTDGHAEAHKWMDARTVQSVNYTPWGTKYPSHYNVMVSADYEWLDARMPYR